MSLIQSSFIRLLIRFRIRKILSNELPIEAQRKLLNQVAVLSFTSPFTKIRQISTGQVNADWIQHHKARSDYAILYLHGGGYNVGSPETSRLVAERLSWVSRSIVLVPDYRLAPEHPFPAALEDAVTSYLWLIERGFSPSSIAVAGDSAGGGLALAALLRLKEMGEPLPASIVMFSPWTDLGLSGDSIEQNRSSEIMLNHPWLEQMAENYRGTEALEHPLVSPLFGELSDLPPALIQVSRKELLYSDSVRLAEAYRSAGNTVILDEWNGLWHAWQLFVKFLPEANQAVTQAGQFIDKHWQSQDI